MDEIKKQFKQVRAVWKKVYKNALSNTAAWNPHLPNTSLVVLNESVETLSTWIDRSRAPNGFSPGYHLAKSLAGIHLPSLLSTAQQLEAGNYNHFPNFVNYLINTLSAVHTMAVYAPKNEQDTLNADFSAELSQALSLLNTTQQELANKSSILEAAQELAVDIESSHKNIQEIENAVTQSKESIVSGENSANKALTEINTYLKNVTTKYEEYLKNVDSQQEEYNSLLQSHQEEYSNILSSHNEEYGKLLDSSKQLNDNLTNMASELERLQEKCQAQEKIIDSILPRGASAGLAAAFSSRGDQLNLTKWIWLSVFVTSLLALVAFAWHIIGIKIPEGATYWDQLLSRLPLAAPLIWLGWFSAIQYGNIIRVQEDYAFKEATSKAYQGYKDHLKHLGNVDLDEAQTALTLLSETTIQVLGREPLRIYGKTEQDASPSHSLLNIFRQRKRQEKSDTTVADND